MRVHHEAKVDVIAKANALPAVPTYGRDDADKLRTTGTRLFSERRHPTIPADIFAAAYDKRGRLYRALCGLADEIESSPGPVEIELVAPAVSEWSTEDCRDILYLVRTALA